MKSPNRRHLRTRKGWATIVGDLIAIGDQPDMSKKFAEARIKRPQRLRPNVATRTAYLKKRMEKWNAPPENAL